MAQMVALIMMMTNLHLGKREERVEGGILCPVVPLTRF